MRRVSSGSWMASSCPAISSRKPGGFPAKPWSRKQKGGEDFAVKVGNRLYYPQAFLGVDREAVATNWRALGDLSSLRSVCCANTQPCRVARRVELLVKAAYARPVLCTAASEWGRCCATQTPLSKT